MRTAFMALVVAFVAVLALAPTGIADTTSYYRVTDPRSTQIGSGTVNSGTACDSGDKAISMGYEIPSNGSVIITTSRPQNPVSDNWNWSAEIISGPTSWTMYLLCAEESA